VLRRPSAHPAVPETTSVTTGAALVSAGVPAGAVLVRGLDVGPTPATPAVMTAPGAGRSEQVLLGAAATLGTAVGYAQEHGGRTVQNIYPLADSVGEQISTSSGVTLAFHTETAFHPHRSRFLLLLCRRGDPGAATTLCSWDAITPHLDEGVRATLGEPRFRIGVDRSFGSTGWTTGPMPVVRTAADGTPEFTYDGELTEGLDAGARAALVEVAAVIAAVHAEVVLETGDLLMVDNRRAVHGRSTFRARFDGTDRWLQRTFVIDSLAGIADRDGAVITTRFVA
jgi:L-asparagine oxygenase